MNKFQLKRTRTEKFLAMMNSTLKKSKTTVVKKNMMKIKFTVSKLNKLGSFFSEIFRHFFRIVCIPPRVKCLKKVKNRGTASCKMPKKG